MPKDQKIATCCYCGTRAALVLGKTRHELLCSSCGAPLHDLKRLRSDAVSNKPVKTKTSKPAGVAGYATDSPRKRKKPKKRKSLGKKLFEEAFDFIEDIFD